MALQIGERQKNDTESIDWGEVHENYDESQIVINIDGASSLSLSLSLSFSLSLVQRGCCCIKELWLSTSKAWEADNTGFEKAYSVSKLK